MGIQHASIMISPQTFNAVFREFITVVKLGTGNPDIKHNIKKDYRAWDPRTLKHAGLFHDVFVDCYPSVVEAGVAKLPHTISDTPILCRAGHTVSEIFDSLTDKDKVRAHACLAALFAISMASNISPGDDEVCAAAHRAVDAALASAEKEAELGAVILDDDLVDFIKGAGALFRIGGTCGLPLDGNAVDGMLSLARSITDNADPAVFERLGQQMNAGKLDLGAIMGEAAQLLGNVDLSKLDLSCLGKGGDGGLDIAGLMSNMGLDMTTVLAALSSMKASK